MRLFCLAHAGASAEMLFAPWHPMLSASGLDVVPIELPGRGTRVREQPLTDASTVVTMVTSALTTSDEPYAVFGHSFGAGLAFAAAAAIAQNAGPLPAHVFLSGRAAPGHPSVVPDVAAMNDSELASTVAKMGGTPPEILAHPALLRKVLPALRADLTMSAQLEQLLQSSPLLPCPLTAITGKRDVLAPLLAISGWAERTSGPFTSGAIEGGHFWADAGAEVVATLESELLATMP